MVEPNCLFVRVNLGPMNGISTKFVLKSQSMKFFQPRMVLEPPSLSPYLSTWLKSPSTRQLGRGKICIVKEDPKLRFYLLVEVQHKKTQACQFFPLGLSTLHNMKFDKLEKINHTRGPT